MTEAGGWHALIPGPITGPDEALAFVNDCGFCTWGPVPRLPFPTWPKPWERRQRRS